MIPLTQLTDYLGSYLRIGEIPDFPNALNGLQVQNSGTVAAIVVAVDASQASIDSAVRQARDSGPVLLIVHHGLFWDGLAPVTGRHHRRLKALLDADVALYGAHIPLDVHPEIGNNAVLARMLGIEHQTPFSDYRGILLGMAGPLVTLREDLVASLDKLLSTRSRLLAGGPAETARVGVITGAAGNRIRSALDAGCDTFITGEGVHHTYFDAMEYGVNVIYAGHYATEQVGVKALGEHLARKFGLPWFFHDHPTGL
jgi:dinuclear metal center YbgI/SA1388 family protein